MIAVDQEKSLFFDKAINLKYFNWRIELYNELKD